MVEKVLLKANRWTKDYIDSLDGARVEKLTEESIIWKAVSQYLNKDMEYSWWITKTPSYVSSWENFSRDKNRNS